MKRIIGIYFFICFIFSQEGNSQSFIAAKSFVKNNTVYLRWVASDFNTFKQCIAQGFVIKRITWNGSNLPDTNHFKNSSFVKTVKPLGENDSLWNSRIQENDENTFIYTVLYKQNYKNVKSEQYFYGLAMLACDQDTSLSSASGLLFIDKSPPTENVAYLISASNNSRQIKPAILLVNPLKQDFLPNPDSLKAKIYKKEIRLIWPEEKYKPFFTGYFVERSEDGISYKQLNKKPHTQIKTKDDRSKTDITYYDTTCIYNITYYYRVKGLNFFGASSNYSNISKVKVAKPITAHVSVDSVKVLNDTMQKIHWHITGNINSQELKGFNIYRSANDSGPYIKVNKSILQSNYFIDEYPLERSYYKVAAFNIYGDSTLSFNIMGLLPDAKPPLPPKNFTGKIDSTGIVNLSWSGNKETDLKGYRVFRCNSIIEEPVEVVSKILMDTTFIDRVETKSLTENVIYYLTAVDKVFNNSKYTLPLILQRPDKIKPVPVIFTSITHTDSCMKVTWNISTSKDVLKYELFRENLSGESEILKTWGAFDTILSFSDKEIEYDNYYSYKIIVYDKSNNSSESLSSKHFYTSRLRKPIQGLIYVIDKESKSILLEWQAPVGKVFSYVLYRAKEGNNYISYKTLKSNYLKYEDKDLNIGNTYLYKIKANFESGAESILSNELKVEF